MTQNELTKVIISDANVFDSRALRQKGLTIKHIFDEAQNAFKYQQPDVVIDKRTAQMMNLHRKRQLYIASQEKTPPTYATLQRRLKKEKQFNNLFVK